MNSKFDAISNDSKVRGLTYFSSYIDIEKCFHQLSLKYHIHARLRYWMKMFKSLQEIDEWITVKNRHNDMPMTDHDVTQLKYIWYCTQSRLHYTRSTSDWLYFNIAYLFGYYNT